MERYKQPAHGSFEFKAWLGVEAEEFFIYRYINSHLLDIKLAESRCFLSVTFYAFQNDLKTHEK